MKKIFLLASAILVLEGASTVYAANDFKFSFVSNIIGKTEFNLNKEYTTCDSNAGTYVYNTNSYADFVGEYCIDLNGNGIFKKDYEGTYQKADGRVHTTNYGEIKKNTYTVDIGSNSHLAQRAAQIKGEGQIKQ